MRRATFIGFMVLGAALGFLSAIDGEWGLQVVMTLIGTLVGTALGGALSRLGDGGSSFQIRGRSIPGLGASSEDLAADFWRDRGHPPFMKPSDAAPDRHQFDPNRLE